MKDKTPINPQTGTMTSEQAQKVANRKVGANGGDTARFFKSLKGSFNRKK